MYQHSLEQLDNLGKGMVLYAEKCLDFKCKYEVIIKPGWQGHKIKISYDIEIGGEKREVFNYFTGRQARAALNTHKKEAFLGRSNQ